MEKEKALELRKRIKSKKPDFVRQDSHKKSKLGKKWRRPKGWQSKIRLHKRGHIKEVSKGFGSPASVSGFHPSGLIPVNISTTKELEPIDPKEQGIVISGKVGMRKKIEIIKKAQEKGIRILSIKDSEKFLKDAESKITERRSAKKEKEKDKEKKKKETESKKEKKEDKLSEKVTEEDKKDQEKKEKDKVLTSK